MPADDFDAWLQDELSALLPPASAPVPARRVSVLNSRRWPRLLGWLLPPVSGKILLATTALAVAGTAGAAAATGHVTLPGDHHNRAVVSPSASVRVAPAPLSAGGAGAPATSAGHPGSRGPGSTPPGPAPRPGAEAPETGIGVGAPAPRESPEPPRSPEPSDSPHPSEPPQPRETPEPVQTSPRAAVPEPSASPAR